MNVSNDKIASVQSQPIQPNYQRSADNKSWNTDNILSFVNKLSFKVSEQEKPQFFSELETILEKEQENMDSDSENKYGELITFFMQHASLDNEQGA